MAKPGEVPRHWTETTPGKAIIGAIALVLLGGAGYVAIKANRLTESIDGDDKHNEATRDSSDDESISGKEAKNRIKRALDAADLLIGEQTGIGSGQYTPRNASDVTEYLWHIEEEYAVSHPGVSDEAAATAADCSYIPLLPKGRVGRVVTEEMVVAVERGAEAGGSYTAAGICTDVMAEIAPGQELPRLNTG